MQVSIKKEGDVFIVSLKGRLNYDTVQPFHQTCMNHLMNEKVVFNLEELSFVGSAGITPFVETIQVLCSNSKESLKFCAVGSEFKRIFSANLAQGAEIYESEEIAKLSFEAPQQQVGPLNLEPQIDEDMID